MVGITIKNVTKKFGATTAVDGVSLEIRKGELFFLLGPSGCGKTTILRMIAGFETPDSGELFFDERAIGTIPAYKRNTGMVFQNYALWPHMSVEQNVAYGLDERGIPGTEKKDRVLKALQSVRMDTYASRMPNQLSGGQQQRIALARALVIEPDAVLLDEPLSNLDAGLRIEMRHEIRRIHDETGITMVYVTHDQKEALSMADRVAVMSMGRVEQVGAPRDIYLTPANRFVATFVGEANLLEGSIKALEAGTASIETALGTFKARRGGTGPTVGARALCMIRPEGIRIGTQTANRFRAKIVKSVFMGEMEEFVLESAGTTLKAVSAVSGKGGTDAGTEVDAGFAVEDALILGL